MANEKSFLSMEEVAAFYENKRILLIGGTGSVGSKMIDKLLSFNPKVIRVFSRDEYKQFILAEKYENGISRKLRFLIGDIRDSERLLRASEGIDIIFSLAAMKHVPACEYNPFEAVKTNVMGTQNVINAAIASGVSNLIFTSSDKAISPTNAMGATKLLAERLLIAADSMKGTARVTFSAVRFGNVLGSRGSVVPFFVNQILKGDPVTITDNTMTRFMMSLDEAVDLTLKSAAVSKGGEIFVLKMPNIAISDLIECVIELACEKYNIDINGVRIKEIGLRPGEKLYEELMTDYEAENAYELPKMYAILPHGYRHIDYYTDFKKAKQSGYSSKTAELISKEEIKRLLIKEGLV